MATRSCICALILAAVVAGPYAAADPPIVKPLGTFTVEVRATAGEQFVYASSIRSTSSKRLERDGAILQSVAAFEIIPKRWPGERDLIMHAWTEIVSRLSGAFLHQNALKYCDKAIAWAGDTPQRLVFIAGKGRSLMWLNRNDEARQAFEISTSAGDFHRLSDFDKSAILIDAAFFYERQRNYAVAAAHTRSRAKLCPDDLSRADAMRKAVDLSIEMRDYGAARSDLAGLSEAALKARMRTLTPAEQEVLRRLDDAIANYRKKLGV